MKRSESVAHIVLGQWLCIQFPATQDDGMILHSNEKYYTLILSSVNG